MPGAPHNCGVPTSRPFGRVLRDGTLAFKAPYDAAFGDALKASVPPDARSYRATGKVWVVAPRFSEVALGLLGAWWPEVSLELDMA